MEKDNSHRETNFAIFICLTVVIALILCSVGLAIYQNNGTVELDRSLPKYLKP
jgi:hypothetical protein